MAKPEKDESWMQLAIEHAYKGLATCSPNPPVGAVVVKQDQILGVGWHQQAGQPHAERVAIADALMHHTAADLQGATIYVTLEPCSTHGRTPPCTQGIIDAGITRVVYGSIDPNPLHVGAADKILHAANIQVSKEICKLDCDRLIRAFSKVQQTSMPWVILKSAISLDGSTTRPPGEGQWLSSPESREIVHQLRNQVDAIITGGNTARIDNPSLTPRSKKVISKIQPWRMVITQGKKVDLPTDLKLFNDSHANRTLVQENGDITSALKNLANRGCNSVLVEAGGGLMAAFLEQQLADELVIFYAPLVTGGADIGFGSSTPKTQLIEQQYTKIGNDVMLRAIVKRHKKTSDPQTVSP